jgi:hypothetical protein
MGDKMPDRGIEFCFIYYQNFNIDFYGLRDAGVLQYVSNNRYDWKRKKTSLAEYFNWIGHNGLSVPGGFWGPISKAFTIKGKSTTKKQLSHLLNKQKNLIKLDSDDFKEIKKIVEKYRIEVQNADEALDRIDNIHEMIHDYFDMPESKQIFPETINNLLDRLRGELIKVDKIKQNERFGTIWTTWNKIL